MELEAVFVADRDVDDISVDSLLLVSLIDACGSVGCASPGESASGVGLPSGPISN